MKKTFKLFIFTLVVTMALPLNIFALENNSREGDNQIQLLENALGKEVVEQLQSQAQAVDAYNYLLDNFIDNDNNNLALDNKYAGAYIKDDKLILSIANSNNEEKKVLKEYFKDYPVVINDAKYSEKELKKVAEYYIENQSTDSNEGYYIDPINNELVITSADGSKNIRPDIPASFRSIPKTETYASTLIGGMGIEINSSTGSTVTLGICGTYNGYNCIATCGHGGWTTSSYVYYGGYNIGKCLKVRCTNLMSGDYSISKITSSLVTTSNLVMSEQDFYEIKGTRTLPVGALAYHYGNATGLGAVEVTATGVTIHSDEGKYIRGMIEASYVSGSYGGPGDSGGPLYAMNSSSQWCISGLMSGGNSSDSSITYYTPISLLTSAGFTVKTN